MAKKTKSIYKLEKIFGYFVYSRDVDLLVSELSNAINSDAETPKHVCCINPHSYYIAKKDSVFKLALETSDYLIPDGIGVLIYSTFNDGAIRDRITGYDFFENYSTYVDKNENRSVFFLGSSEKTLTRVINRYKIDFPNIKINGFFSPPFASHFTDEQNDEMIQAINAAKPDILWVAMSAPKQEKWVYSNIHKLDVKVVASIGAVFDFYTGNIKRSSVFFQRIGLEWLPRFLQEPKRLWRRIFISAPIFLYDMVKERFI